jgi:prolipoprotein diacylglyceryltransferase
MTFPVVWTIFGREIHAHNVMETLAYTVGGFVYRYARKRSALAREPVESTLWVISAAAFGAWAGSKVLAIVEMPEHYLPLLGHVELLFEGKTIVGGLLGAWAGVEIAKRCLSVRSRTGDAFVPTLTAAIPIGRIGCFLEGLPDHTYGTPTSLPWGVDFGDGIARHPTQLYESIFVLVMGTLLCLTKFRREGDRFRVFFAGYFLFRFGVEFIKPREHLYGPLSAIQWASAFGVAMCIWQLARGASPGPPESPAPPLTAT